MYAFLKYKAYRKILIFILFVDALSILNGYLNRNGTYIQALHNLAAQAFGVQLFLVKDRMKLVRNIFLLIYFYIVIKVIFFPHIDFYGDKGVSELVGKNSISIVMIVSCVIDLFYRTKNAIKINYMLYIIGLGVSVITQSSGGMLGFSLFLLGIYICSSNGKKISFWKVFGLLIIFVLGSIYLDYGNKILMFLSDDNSRFALWGMYFKLATQNIESLLLGGGIAQNAILSHYGNIHNNILNWHCYYGLIPTIVYVSIISMEIIVYLKNRAWYKLVISSVLFVRSMTDSTDYIFMSIWIFMLLDILVQYENKKKLRWRLSNETKEFSK